MSYVILMDENFGIIHVKVNLESKDIKEKSVTFVL